ncbi:hypothetical protein D7004_02430 [Pedobacter jejuensis]|uniref:Uncharacterized protein n=1 Tax=Pedobacter jejuensis TaxID=1268550 RepID=A0A3N0C232_9SPHI|nr:hypothetical protein D7004_02430 [Pedobacter jejuensis]
MNLNNNYLCNVIFNDNDDLRIPTDPEFQKGMGFIFSCTAEHKKCCEKYKKGKRCKKCPGKDKK